MAKKIKKVHVHTTPEEYKALGKELDKEWEAMQANPLVKQLMKAMRSI